MSESQSNKKIVVGVVLILAVAILAAFCGYRYLSYRADKDGISKFKMSSIGQITAAQGAKCWIDKGVYAISDMNKVIDIQGWGFIKGTKSKQVQIDVLLKEQGSDNCFKLPTTMEIRADVTRFFHDGTDYNNSGFILSVNGQRFDLENKQYEIWLLYSIGKEQYLVNTGKCLTKAQ